MNAPALVGFVTGATAVGKSEAALLLCEQREWELLSVDSRQVYRGLDVGTAKPTAAERARVVHHGIDLIEPSQAFSAGGFREYALGVLEQARRSGRRLLAVGGAGFYWEALIRGLHPLPPASPEIRRRHARIVAEEGPEALHALLRSVDPATAARLAPRDRQRASRALEVAELTGIPLSAHLRGRRTGSLGGGPADGWVDPKGGTPAEPPREDAIDQTLPMIVALTRPRPELYRRIEERCRRMMAAGLVAELAALLRQGVPPDAPGLRTVGYREFLPHLLEGRALAVCEEGFVRASRRYAKRQETWLRHRLPERIELRVGDEEPAAETAVRIARALAGGGEGIGEGAGHFA